MSNEAKHISVLLNECIENLNINPDGIYVDGTLGLGGHSEQILKRLDTGRLIGIDRDESAIRRTGERLAQYADKMTLVHGNFCDVSQILDELGVDAVDGMLFDLGVSSPQLDEAEIMRNAVFPTSMMRRLTCAWIIQAHLPRRTS